MLCTHVVDNVSRYIVHTHGPVSIHTLRTHMVQCPYTYYVHIVQFPCMHYGHTMILCPYAPCSHVYAHTVYMVQYPYMHHMNTLCQHSLGIHALSLHVLCIVPCVHTCIMYSTQAHCAHTLSTHNTVHASCHAVFRVHTVYTHHALFRDIHHTALGVYKYHMHTCGHTRTYCTHEL